MDDTTKTELIRMGWTIHAAVEESYRHHPASRGGDSSAWQEKQRLLLADMAIHLLQTAIKPEGMDRDKLRDNLHAILTIADGFLPHAELKKASDRLYDGQGS